jgi:hypothetical protein
MVGIYSAGEIGGASAVTPIKDLRGRDVKAPVMVLVDGNGRPTGGGVQETLTLVANSVATAGQSAYGGDYQARAFATDWAGGSAKLQFLDADGQTWTDLANADGSAVAPFTANRTQVLGLGSNASIRAVITGAPVKLYIVVSRQP